MRPIPRLVASLLLLSAWPAAACELDGLSHGYGPMSALFAGAHRYQSLNGVEAEVEEPAAETDAPAPAADPAREDAPVRASAASPTAPLSPPQPRRSFVAWAKARPKPTGAAEAPATWTRTATPSAEAPSVAAPPSPPERKPRP